MTYRSIQDPHICSYKDINTMQFIDAYIVYIYNVLDVRNLYKNITNNKYKE
jgi:hypothetical protein